MKEYTFEIKLNFVEQVDAKNKVEAIKQIKEGFYQDYGIEVINDDMKEVKS